MIYYQGLQADVVSFRGHNNDQGEAYYARPTRAGKFPGIVVTHHIPGWCEWTTEIVRKMAHHGYAAISPHLYFREGGPEESPDDLGARIRAAGGVADAQVMGDVAGAMAYLRAQPNATGKIGVIGFCSGGRHTYLAACTLKDIDAAVDCWGGNVVVDNPKADQVNRTEALLKKLGKNYEFHRYNGAGHAFFNWQRDAYRPDQAMDGWRKVFEFFNRNLATSASSVAAE